MRRHAILSDDRAYRYLLTRDDVGGASGCRVSFIMVNPSTADEEVDDATIRKCVGFARRWDYSSLSVVNLFAERTPDVRVLGRRSIIRDPRGPLNDHYVKMAMATGHLVVAAWGRLDKLPPALRHQASYVVGLARGLGVQLRCLGRTAGGDPCHPLMLAYATRLEDYP